MPGDAMTTEDLESFFVNGWNSHDVDAAMAFMADDCVFESAAGPDACGTRHTGRSSVRDAFARIFERVPDVQFRERRHLVAGDRGVSEWTFTGTSATGAPIEVDGCDLFVFERGKIRTKSTFLKNRTA